MTGKQFLTIIIATFITVLAWVIFDLVHTRSQIQIPAETQQLLEPVNPVFDQEVINNL